MMRKQIPGSSMLSVLLLVFCFAFANARLAVMSIDLGGEFMKIAIVKPGVPMEIVLNKESSRKTPTLVAFRDGERQFGNQAQSTAVKFPAKAYAYLPQIVGRQFNDPQVELFRQRFPYYTMEEDPDRGTVLFKTDDDQVFSVEELLAMILDKAREYAQDFAEQEIKDAVITVPSFFNQAERRAVLTAAQMVGINVLQLMSDNAAVALNYGVFRRNNFNSTTQYYMFYDMGATSTTATIVGYNVAKTKEGTITETNPQLTIKGVGFDRTLGGLEMTLRLRDHLAKTFNDQKKTTLKVEENPRAMAKLLKESERVKKVLSANVDHHAQVEGLLDEKDFRGHVTRAELEEMSKDLFERLTKPIEDALKVSEITLPEINEVILMGGGTRMPKVQEILVKYLGRSDLGKSINTDEAAAMGAVYQAAYLGKGFKVKKFGVREGNIYPISVEFEKQKSEDSVEELSRTIKRTLFGCMNPFPQRKVMTFNKHTKDFGFNVSYTGLDFLNEEDMRSFGSTLIGKYNLLGVQEALAKNKDVAESKGIKAHFNMDGSGILTLDKVESIFEKNDTQEEEKSTWSKLGNAIGGLFGGGSKQEDTKVEDSTETPESSEGASNDTTSDKDDGEDETNSSSSDDNNNSGSTDAGDASAAGNENKTETPEEAVGEGEEEKKEKSEPEGESEQEKKHEEKTEESKDKESGETKDKDAEKPEEGKDKTEKTEEKKDEEKKSGEEEKKEEKEAPKVVNIKENIKSEVQVMDVLDLTEERFKQSKKRLADLRKADEEKVELEKSQNELESFIFDMQDKLSQEEYEKCSTAEEREALQTKLSEASDWLYEIEGAKKADFTEKLKSLQEGAKPIAKRVFELKERPKALELLRETLNQTTVFLATLKNLTNIPGAEGLVEEAIFTPVEVETMEKVIVDTRKWRDDILKEQEKLADSQDPVLLVDDVLVKVGALDREMRYLINKAKNYKPKPKPKPEAKDEKTANKTEESGSETKKDEGEKAEDSAEKTEGEQVPPPPAEETPTASSDEVPTEDNSDNKKDGEEKEEDNKEETKPSGEEAKTEDKKSEEDPSKEEDVERNSSDGEKKEESTIDSSKTQEEETKTEHIEL